jgi:hypothetical protein
MKSKKKLNMSKAEARRVLKQRKNGKSLAKKKKLAKRVLKCSGCKNKATIRGACKKCYRKYMHQIERGDTTERSLVSRKLLLPGKGIALNRDNKIFNKRSKVKGKGKAGECRIPYCKNKQSRRGLCNTHRVYAHRMIRLGKTTEANLLRRGILLEKASPVRRTKKSKSKKTTKTKKKTIKKRTKNSTNCISPRCTIKRHGRGLCKKHYNRTMRKIKKGEAFEKDLEKRKLLLPRKYKRSETKKNPTSDIFKSGSIYHF